MIRAVHFATLDELKVALTPGGFHVTAPSAPGTRDEGTQGFWYCCPCGCGVIGRLRVGNGFKPGNGTSWLWNGSFEAPELSPSVNHVDHWHGWLRAGEWVLA